MPTLDQRVAAVRDSISNVPSIPYWEEFGPLYLIGNASGMTTALRFTGLGIPQGATIISATVTVYANLAQGSAADAWADIGAEQVDDASQLTSGANHESRKTNLGTEVQWGPHAGIAQHAAFVSPDLSAIVQEVVDRAGWDDTSAIQFFVTPNPSTTVDYQFHSYYDESGTPARLPRLQIEWTEAPELGAGAAVGEGVVTASAVTTAFGAGAAVGEGVAAGTPGDSSATEVSWLELEAADGIAEVVFGAGSAVGSGVAQGDAFASAFGVGAAVGEGRLGGGAFGIPVAVSWVELEAPTDALGTAISWVELEAPGFVAYGRGAVVGEGLVEARGRWSSTCPYPVLPLCDPAVASGVLGAPNGAAPTSVLSTPAGATSSPVLGDPDECG